MMPLAVKNVQHGMTTPDGRFIPFRGSSDYDPSRAGEPKKWASKWKYEDKPRKRKAAAKKRTAKKTAKRTTAKRTMAAKRSTGGRRGVAMSRNPSWDTHPYWVVVKGSNGSPIDYLEGWFKTLAAAKKYAQGLRTRGLTYGRVVEIYRFGDKPGLVSSKQNPSSLQRQLADRAFDAGKEWGLTGSWSSGVSNANVRRYGFVKWWNSTSPAETKGVRKTSLERAFYEGYKIGREKANQGFQERAKSKNPIPAKWTQAKVMRTKTGDVKVMLTGRPGRK